MGKHSQTNFGATHVHILCTSRGGKLLLPSSFARSGPRYAPIMGPLVGPINLAPAKWARSQVWRALDAHLPHVCRAERGQPLCVSITMQGYAAKDFEGLSLAVFKMQSHESNFQKPMGKLKNPFKVQLKKARQRIEWEQLEIQLQSIWGPCASQLGIRWTQLISKLLHWVPVLAPSWPP
jgi:hypothetical protein